MLQVNNVSKAYRSGRTSLQVLADVSVSVAPGERLGLVGVSGAGKSTLAYIMALLMRPDRGTVSVEGSMLRGFGLRLSPHVRRQVQLVWQSPRLSTDPRYTLQQVISEPLRGLDRVRRSQAIERLNHLKERVGLADELLERHPHAVSDGQLQRACLLRALVVQPKYLVCDEFTAMLDASTQAALLNTIAEEQARCGMGVVLITHDHELARHWCDRLVEVSGGQVSEAQSAAPLVTGRVQPSDRVAGGDALRAGGR